MDAGQPAAGLDTRAVRQPSPTVQVDVAHFPATAGAVPQVRARTVSSLSEWAVEPEAIGAAELVACELASNAVKASRPEDLVALRLTVCDGVLTVEVWDGSTALPRLTSPGEEQEGGRGLMLVDAVCLRWACYRPRAGGKVVWAQLPAATPPITCAADPAALSTRIPGEVSAPADPVAFTTDSAVLQRVIDGLRGLDSWHLPPTDGVVHGQLDHAGRLPGDRASMTGAFGAVPGRLRHVVLLARMRDMVPADQVAQLLGRIVPLHELTWRQWGALCDALDVYDRLAWTGAGNLAAARRDVNAAAAALLGSGQPRPARRRQSHPRHRSVSIPG